MRKDNQDDEDDEFFEPTGPKDWDEQTDAFRFELDDMVDRYLQEFDIKTITIIGALKEKMYELIEAGNAEMDIDPDEDTDDDLYDDPFNE